MQRVLSVIYRIHQLTVAGFTVDLGLPGGKITGQFLPQGMNQAVLYFGDGIERYRFANLVGPSHALRLNPNMLRSVAAGGMVTKIRYSIDVAVGENAVRPTVWTSEDLEHDFPRTADDGLVRLEHDTLQRWGRPLFERAAFNTVFTSPPVKLPGVTLAQFAD